MIGPILRGQVNGMPTFPEPYSGKKRVINVQKLCLQYIYIDIYEPFRGLAISPIRKDCLQPLYADLKRLAYTSSR